MSKKNRYIVAFKRGLGQPFETEAANEADAKMEGLAKYRCRHGLVSSFKVDEIVESATLIQEPENV